MFQEERLMLILRHLEQNRRISVEEICGKFGVSRDTARRDILRLEEQGAIMRTRGGAMLPSLSKRVDDYDTRLTSEAAGKRAIGRRCAALIRPGDYIIMDSSTTVQEAAAALAGEDNVVVTNSIDIAAILARKEGVAVHLIGGQLHPKHRFVYGAKAISMICDYQVDKALLGACGITADGLSNLYEEESFLIREIICRADQVIVLADHSKFGKRLFHRVAGLDSVDILITDREPEPDVREALARHEVELVIAEAEGGDSQ